MSRFVSRPYLLPIAERVRLSDWQLEMHGSLERAPELLPAWDSAVPIRATVRAEVDAQGVLVDCGLSSDAELRLAASWYSPGTGLRRRGSFVDLDAQASGKPYSISLEAGGGELALSIHLQASLVLRRPGASPSVLSPRVPGSLLWGTQKVVLLEGDAARFPVELIDFASGGLAHCEDASWFLDWNPDDFEQTVLGGMRLLLNSRHERVRKAVAELDGSDAGIREAIRFEVARAMIAAALGSEDFGSAVSYTDGAVGAALKRLLAVLFPTDSLAGLRAAFEQAPQRFDMDLQHRLRLFWPQGQ